MDVLEIDAATHTRRRQRPRGHHLRARHPARARSVQGVHHRRSPPAVRPSSFNALLKSIEEPPPHVVFMMATTELDKIPETILSRSQVYEFRTISGKAIADQLRRIVDAMEIEVGDDCAAADRARCRRQHARRAEQARPGDRVHGQRRSTAADVATVLGLVGRDLLLDAVEACRERERAGGVRPGRRAPSRWGTTCAPSAGS